MRFTLVKKDSTIKPILIGLLSFTIIYLISDVFVKYSSFGIFKEQIKITLFGNKEQFIEALPKSSFLEFIHIEIFFIMMITLTISAVFIRVSNNKKNASLISSMMMITALISLITLALSFFISGIFIDTYVATFLLWHLIAFFISFYCLWRLSFAKCL